MKGDFLATNVRKVFVVDGLSESWLAKCRVVELSFCYNDHFTA